MAGVKKIARKVLTLPFVNGLLRSLVRRFSNTSNSFSKAMMRYVQVSGTVQATIGGEDFRLWSRADDALVTKLYYSRDWEKNVIDWFPKFSAKCNTIIDAGANIGFFSLVA